jgi:hypothetical protein
LVWTVSRRPCRTTIVFAFLVGAIASRSRRATIVIPLLIWTIPRRPGWPIGGLSPGVGALAIPCSIGAISALEVTIAGGTRAPSSRGSVPGCILTLWLAFKVLARWNSDFLDQAQDFFASVIESLLGSRRKCIPLITISPELSKNFGVTAEKKW